MCIVCRSPQRLAVEAYLRAGTKSLRAIEADFPALNRNSLSRHHRMHMTGAPAGTPFARGCNGEDQAAPQSTTTVRRRTRPVTDEEGRLRAVTLMRARGCTHAEIARALGGIHPSTVREVISRANRNALEQVRSDTVEELVAQHRAERHARVQELTAIIEDAKQRNDVSTRLSALRELRHEAKEDREWMERLGAFDHYRLHTADHRDKMPGQEGLDVMHEAFREIADAIGSLDNDSRTH